MTTTSSVANEFLSIKGHDLTNLKLNKLMYIAQGLCLAILKRPLFSDDRIEAWRYGPVIPSVYYEFRHHGRRIINSKATYAHNEFGEITTPMLEDDNDKKIVALTWKSYGEYTGEELIEMTHDKGTPWSLTHEKYGNNSVISNSLIKEYYDIVVGKALKDIDNA